MKFEGRITAEDYVKAQYLHLRPRPIIAALGAAFLAFTYLVTIFAAFQNKTNSTGPYWLALLLLLLVANFLILLPYRTRKAFRRKKVFQAPIGYEITPESLISSDSLGATKLSWREFHTYKVSKNLILLYRSNFFTHMFPTSWFTPEQLNEFQNLLARQLGKPRE